MKKFTREQVMTAYRDCWNKYPTAKHIIPSAMIAMILGYLNEMPSDKACDEIRIHLLEEAMAGKLWCLPRGKHAGFYRTQADMPALKTEDGPIPGDIRVTGSMELPTHPYPPSMIPFGESADPDIANCKGETCPCKPEAAVVNNHTCPSCKNDRCSKSETSCWKCGSKLI